MSYPMLLGLLISEHKPNHATKEIEVAALILTGLPRTPNFALFTGVPAIPHGAVGFYVACDDRLFMLSGQFACLAGHSVSSLLSYDM